MIATHDELIIDDNNEIIIDKINTLLDERKVSTLNGNAQLLVSDKICAMTSATNGIITSDIGNIIKGKLSLTNTPSDIRINQFWTLNDDLLTTLPSTIYTPIPVLNYSPSNYIKFAQSLIKSMSV